jgi:hypothetical protein
MTAVAELFETWRGELAADLAEAEQALAGAVADLTAAEGAHDAARVEHQALRAAIAPLRSPIASALAARVRGGDEGLHDAASAAGRARAVVIAGRERVADLRQALQQIDQLLAPAAEDAATEETANA